MSVSICPQELIYKEFFSQGDLVCVSVHWLLNGMWDCLTSDWRVSFYAIMSTFLMSVLCVCVCVCAGKGHGEQAQWDDGPGESVHPRTTDKLHGTYRHAHIQVSANPTLLPLTSHHFTGVEHRYRNFILYILLAKISQARVSYLCVTPSYRPKHREAYCSNC